MCFAGRHVALDRILAELLRLWTGACNVARVWQAGDNKDTAIQAAQRLRQPWLPSDSIAELAFLLSHDHG